MILSYPDPSALASDAAARLVARIVEAQSARGSASIVLTGGRSGAAIYSAVRDSPALDTVDWSMVDIWWGDERFLPAGHPDRNDTQAWAALLDAVPVNPARVHPMPPSDGPDGDDPEAAAARYAAELVASPPHFDLLLLGVGEDGHVASIFPGHPADPTRAVYAVRNSPKPPPVRITLAMSTLNTAEDVWLLASGADKAQAVGRALTAGSDLPAAGVHGLARTVWMLDAAAAADVPADLGSDTPGNRGD